MVDLLRTIHNAFEDIFSKERSDYEGFKQKQAEELSIVVDDFNSIEEDIQNLFSEYLEAHFGIIVETYQQDIDMDVDIRDRLRRRAFTREYTWFKISPFYTDKRKELVGKVVPYLVKNKEAHERIISNICDILTKQKYLFSLNPDFIVQFTRHYCSNIGDYTQNDGSVFSKVFVSNLTNMLSPYTTEIDVDKVFIIVDKIAYFIYVNSAYPVSLAQIDSIIKEYNNDYGQKIPTSYFMDILRKAKIVKDTPDGILFCDRNYLSYFAAREIKRRCQDGDFSQFDRVMNNMHMSINADILLFITYITESESIIRRLIKQGYEVVEKWNEFDLEKTDIKFLTSPTEDFIKPVSEEDRETEAKERIREEKREVRNAVIANDASIFHGEDEELGFLQEIVKSISLMMIISRTLLSFEYFMKANDKQNCIKLIYQMPLKIFDRWAREVNTVTGELIDDIKDFHEWEYRKDNHNYVPLDDEKALGILRWEAISMLLELMNVAISNSTRYNTIDSIESFPFRSKPSYRIEHLMSLGRLDNVSEFISEANQIIKEKGVITKTMARRVARNYIVNSKHMTDSQRHSINTTVLDQAVSNSRLLYERNRNKKRQ